MSARVIDTTKVPNRRLLKFSTIADIQVDVEKLAAGGPPKALGNWTAGQILKHLAGTMNYSLDGFPFTLPWYVRLFGKVFKGYVLNKPMSAGFNLSREAQEKMVPAAVSWDEGLADIRAALQRLQAETKRSPSPFLGQLTNEQWTKLHCRHAELHLSFLVPFDTV